MLSHADPNRFKGKRLGVLYGGETEERDVSLQTGHAFVGALKQLGYEVLEYDIPADIERLVEERPDAVLIALHGGLGENGGIQGFLETLQIPYTGSGVMASAIAMDKARAKSILRASGIPTPGGSFMSGQRFDAGASETYLRSVDLPCVVKVNDAGSSVGVYLCHEADQFVHACEGAAALVVDRETSGVLFEEYIEGPEYSVGFFDGMFLGAIRIEPGEAFYDYKAKYQSNDTKYAFVEDADLMIRLEAIGRATYDALGCRGVARVDVIGHEDTLKVLEVNTIPGMTATSLIPKMADQQGVPFEQFTELMISAARL